MPPTLSHACRGSWPRSRSSRFGPSLPLLLLIWFGGSGTSEGIAQVQAEPSDSPATAAEAKEDRVLRHAVFFKFKASSAPDEIERVVDSFCALPGKIDSIKGFEWGTNNSPEGLDDGFTHCFLLTFANQEALAEYVPHAEHRALGELLTPHLEDAFVFDYWGTETAKSLERPLRHAVFFQFKQDAGQAAITAVEQAFAELPAKIDAVAGLEWGTANNPGDYADGFTHCFLVTFPSEDARAAYLPHPEHQAFVQQLKPVLEKVRVLDFWAKPATD
jgi:quinol monooxygenase YgiN